MREFKIEKSLDCYYVSERLMAGIYRTCTDTRGNYLRFHNYLDAKEYELAQKEKTAGLTSVVGPAE